MSSPAANPAPEAAAAADTSEKTPENVEVVAVPKDALYIDAILRSMGVREYEPKVVNQLLEFMHRHAIETLSDALVFRDHVGRAQLHAADIRLAIQSKMNHSFLQPPPRELLHSIANERNRVPLPVINQDRAGVRLPPEEFCLTATNYQVEADLRSL